jgi:hypothetical protein
MPFHRLALLFTALLVPACLVDGEPTPFPLDELADHERCLGCQWGPPLTNTHGLNGLSVSALDMTGATYDGWRLHSIEIVTDRGIEPVYEVHVIEGVLYGRDALGLEYSGEDFVDSEWTIVLESSEKLVVMEIDDFVPDPSATRYTFVGGDGSIPTDDRGGFTCALDPETQEYSVVLFDDLDVDPDDGTHFERPDTIYFGCLSGAVGKSALWGYSPWRADHASHQTASRAVRADFCGDGTPYTIQGTGLQVTDVFHLRDFTKQEKPTEAMWGPNGAECIMTPRLGQRPEDIVCNGGQTLPLCGINDELPNWPNARLWTKIWE